MAGPPDPVGDRLPRSACEALGISFSTSNEPEAVLAKIGPIARMLGATLTNTANPTMLRAGYKVNVVPQTASAQIDGRFLPGYEDEFFAEIDELLGPERQPRVRNNSSRSRPRSTARSWTR